MYSHGTTRTAITLLAATTLLVQSVYALPMSCHCAEASTRHASVASCCNHDSDATEESCCASRESCFTKMMADCVDRAQNSDATNCRCGCGDRDQHPVATPQVTESFNEWLVSFAICQLIVSDADKITPSHISSLQTTPAYGGASRCAQILFCIWRI